jgi:glycosyltransferase involved in cell wall biosynthesis
VVSVRSEEEIYQALVHLAEDRVQAGEAGAAARTWVVRHHGWEAVTERFLRLYNELAGTSAVAAQATAR